MESTPKPYSSISAPEGTFSEFLMATLQVANAASCILSLERRCISEGSGFSALLWSVFPPLPSNCPKSQNVPSPWSVPLKIHSGCDPAVRSGVFFCAAAICATRTTMDTMVETLLTATSCYAVLAKSVSRDRLRPSRLHRAPTGSHRARVVPGLRSISAWHYRPCKGSLCSLDVRGASQRFGCIGEDHEQP